MNTEVDHAGDCVEAILITEKILSLILKNNIDYVSIRKTKYLMEGKARHSHQIQNSMVLKSE